MFATPIVKREKFSRTNAADCANERSLKSATPLEREIVSFLRLR